MTAIEICRTAALGGHVDRCQDCAHTRVAYNSCRNRHCPKCQWSTAAAWLAAREAELLPVPYFHLVFTLPAAIGAIAYQNKAKVYGLLLKAAAETLTTVAADRKHLGADIGVTAVLHTWGQNLQHHPHVHCIVPGGGISPDGKRWIACKPGSFLPDRVLSRLFRRLFLEGLTAAFDAGELQFFTDLVGLNEAKAFAAALAPLRTTEWVVYAKKPFAGPKQVLAYLARYTHRVAIANSRLLDLDADPRHLPLEGLSGKRRSPEQSHANSRSPSSFAASSSMYCRMASIAFVTTVSLPTDIAPTSSRFAEACSMCPRRRRIATTMMTTTRAPPTTNHPRALAAAVA